MEGFLDSRCCQVVLACPDQHIAGLATLCLYRKHQPIWPLREYAQHQGGGEPGK